MVARDLLSEDVFIKRITSAEVSEGLTRSIAGFIISLSNDTESSSRTVLNNMLTELHDSGLPVQILQRIYPVFTVKIGEFLRRSDIRAALIKYGNILLQDVLENLSTFQRLMLTM
jgi:hypothetical protein